VIAVVDYGIGNLRSAEKALEHLGAEVALVTDPDLVAGADGVVLPGVGAFGPCAQALRQRGLEPAVRDTIGRGVPFLGICVGYQLLYEGSEEDPATPGLGILPGVVRALPAGEKRPQMQWNVITPTRPGSLLADVAERPWVYFVHSFAPELTGDTVAVCDYGGPIVAAAERGSLWGTQFHPEKSGATGLAILDTFVTAVGAVGGCPSGGSGPSGTPGGSGGSGSSGRGAAPAGGLRAG